MQDQYSRSGSSAAVAGVGGGDAGRDGRVSSDAGLGSDVPSSG